MLARVESTRSGGILTLRDEDLLPVWGDIVLREDCHQGLRRYWGLLHDLGEQEVLIPQRSAPWTLVLFPRGDGSVCSCGQHPPPSLSSSHHGHVVPSLDPSTAPLERSTLRRREKNYRLRLLDSDYGSTVDDPHRHSTRGPDRKASSTEASDSNLIRAINGPRRARQGAWKSRNARLY
jgi:hypothetical protein